VVLLGDGGESAEEVAEVATEDVGGGGMAMVPDVCPHEADGPPAGFVQQGPRERCAVLQWDCGEGGDEAHAAEGCGVADSGVALRLGAMDPLGARERRI
jgi:hypothetical protein